jgi:phosphoribosyl-ATP pyrophosphohydrolase/phosphoribosyl-AMP cyclohydrolase
VSCFGAAGERGDAVRALAETVEARAVVGDAATSYTARLLVDRNLRLKKLGEEAVELATACVDNDVERVRNEAADLVYHTLVASRAAGVTWREVQRTLAERRG